MRWLSLSFCFFFFNDTATTEIYTLSLHDALPISLAVGDTTSALSEMDLAVQVKPDDPWVRATYGSSGLTDRKSTRLNSSHSQISYAVFCLKKKKKKTEL